MKQFRYRDSPVILGTGNLATVAFSSSCSCGWRADNPQRSQELRVTEWEEHVSSEH